jgi:signal transduction histidine kinase
MVHIKLSFAIRITFSYLIVGALWILFSDKLVELITKDPILIFKIQLFKGWFFVLGTSLLLFIFIRQELKKRNTLINQLQDANKRAMESDNLKTAFLGNLSHYIRTPMNSILGFADLLEQRNISHEKRALFYNLINQQSKHLLQFINNIVDISKIQSGQLEVSKKFFYINSSLFELYKEFLLEIEENKLNVKLNYSVVLPAGHDIMLSDEEKIHHILINLIKNACNAAPNGQVTFGYTIEIEKIVFYVQDNGCGVPEYVKKYMFKSFVFPVPSELKVTDGFGLGLFLSAGLVKLLNGDLWLDFSNGQGTKFCFSVPWEK